MKIAIIAFENNNHKAWDPESINDGIAGSEEAIIYLSKELVSLGHEVFVFGDPPEDTKHINSKQGYGAWKVTSYFYLLNTKFDLGILWRRNDVETARIKCDKVFIWHHDLSTPPPQGKYLLAQADGIMLLSEYHKDAFIKTYYFENIPIKIVGNGVELSQFNKPKSFTNKYSIGYYSNYLRGLINLLTIWPRVKEQFPEAELSICYGRETWTSGYDDVKNKIFNLIEKYQIKEYGMVGHEELANIMQSTSIWAYPLNSMSETFCITAVKTQLSGMIPVTNKITALKEVVCPNAPFIECYNLRDIPDQFYDKLIEVMKNIDSYNRDEYIEYAKQYSWKEVARKTIELYDDINS